MDDQMVGTAQVSAMTGIPQATLRYWRHMGTGPASFCLGRRVVYRVSEINRWVAEREAETRRGGANADEAVAV